MKTHPEIFLDGVGKIIGFLFIFSGIGVLVYQVYQWFRIGYWYSTSVLVPFQGQGGNDWANYPRDWMGWHKFLDTIPLSVAVFAVGILILYFFREED